MEYTKEDVQEKLNRISNSWRQNWTLAQTLEELRTLGEMLRIGIKGKRTPAKFKDSIRDAFLVLRTCIVNSLTMDQANIESLLALQDYLVQTPGVVLEDVLLPAPLIGDSREYYINAITDRITARIAYILEFEDAGVLASLFSTLSYCRYPVSVISHSAIPDSFKNEIYSKVSPSLKGTEIGSFFSDRFFLDATKNNESVDELKLIAGKDYYKYLLSMPSAVYVIEKERSLATPIYEIGDINQIAEESLTACLKLNDPDTTRAVFHLGAQDILSGMTTEQSAEKIGVIFGNLSQSNFSKAIELLNTLEKADDNTLKVVLTALKYPGLPDSLQEHIFATAFHDSSMKMRVMNVLGDRTIIANLEEDNASAPEASEIPVRTFVSCRSALRANFSKYKDTVYEIAMHDPAVSYMIWRSALSNVKDKSISQEHANFLANMDFVWNHIGSKFSADRTVYLDDILSIYSVTQNIGYLPQSIIQPMQFKDEYKYPQRFEFFNKISEANAPGLLIDFYKLTRTNSIAPSLSKFKEAWPLVDRILFGNDFARIKYLIPLCDADYMDYLSRKMDISFVSMNSLHRTQPSPIKEYGIEPMQIDEEMKNSWELIRTSEKDMDSLLDLFKHKLCSTNQLGLPKPDAAVDTDFTFNIM